MVLVSVPFPHPRKHLPSPPGVSSPPPVPTKKSLRRLFLQTSLITANTRTTQVLLIRFVTARTATSRDVFRLAAAAAENGQPLAIAPAAQGFVSSVRGALRDRGTLLESLQECPPQRSKIDIDPQFLSQVGPEGVRILA